MRAWAAPEKRMTTFPIEALPLWAVIVDYALGLVMWTLIGRFAFGIFMPEDSPFFFNRIFVRATNPLIRLFKWVTPPFLIDQFKPLYVAWFFFMIRFYPVSYTHLTLPTIYSV